MKTTSSVDAARVELLLADLRLPAIKLMWKKLAEQADKEGWPAARFLAALAEHEIAERGRRRTRRCRYVNGRTFLHPRARSDVATPNPQRHSRGRCRHQTEKPENNRHSWHTHGHGDPALWWDLLGGSCAARRRGARTGPQELHRDGDRGSRH